MVAACSEVGSCLFTLLAADYPAFQSCDHARFMYKTRGNTCHFHGSKILNKSPKGLEKVLLESSRALANLTVPSEHSDKESDKGKYVCIVLQITNVSY